MRWSTIWMRAIPSVVMGALAFLPSTCKSQTISPIISEYVESADGSFQARNEGTEPINVVLEAHSFSVDLQGNAIYRGLDPEVRLELSVKSFRVLPHRPYTVYYKARASRLPVWFTIYASFQGRPVRPGLQLAIRLPHTVYLLGKQRVQSTEIAVSKGLLDVYAHKITFTIESKSLQFDRPQSIELRSPVAKKEYPGFPCFPGQARQITLDWDSPMPPSQVEIVFTQFKFRAPFPARGTGP
jgi:hypothetical protein